MIIQGYSVSKQIIDQAKWNVKDLSNMQIGSKILVNIKTNDKDIIQYMKKNDKINHSISDHYNNGGILLTLTFTIDKVTHMVSIGENTIETMVSIIPINNSVNDIILYILDKKSCNQRFISMIKSTN